MVKYMQSAAKHAQEVVRKYSPNEQRIMYWWSLYILVFYPPFDFFSLYLWLPAALGAWVVGMIIMWAYLYGPKAKVRVKPVIPPRFLVALGLLMSASIALAIILMNQRFEFAWTVVGVVLACAFFACSQVIKFRLNK
jgi:hypothetical protein